MATLSNSTSGSLVTGSSGVDSIYNNASFVTINAGDSNDTVQNGGNNGNGYWYNGGNSVIINTGNGDDSVYNYYGSNISISMGASNDYLYSYGNMNVTISGGAGDDTAYVYGAGMVYVYNSGDGKDILYGLNEDDTILIPSGSWSTTKSGNDIIVTVGNGNMTLYGAATLSALNITSSTANIHPINILQNTRSNTIVTGTNYNDSIYNGYNSVTINAGAGNDSVYNYGSNVSISMGDGKDYVYNSGVSNVTISGGAGDDTAYVYGAGMVYIYNNGDGKDILYGLNEDDTILIPSGSWSTTKSGNNIIVTVGNGNMTLYGAATLSALNITSSTANIHPINILQNTSSNTIVTGTNYGDSIYNGYSSVTVNAGAGNDTVYSYGSNVSISMGDGKDSVYNSGNNVTISGGAGDDTVYSYGNNLTISGGTGNDKINLDSTSRKAVIKYASGDGNDTISGYNLSDMISLTSGSVTGVSVSGNDLILKISTGSIHLTNTRNANVNGTIYGESNTIGTSGNDNITNVKSNVTINGYGGNDSIENSGANVSINTGEGNNTIKNYGSNATIKTGTGSNHIYNYESGTKVLGNATSDSVNIHGASVSVESGAGKDYIYLNNNSFGGAYVTINAGADNDSIIGRFGDSSILGGAGDDVVSMTGDVDRGTISAGTGLDTVYMDNYDGRNMIQYTSGDGNDIIYYFNRYDTLKIGNGSTDTYSKATVGSDIHVSVGNGVITLKNAASLESVNISGREVAVSLNPSNPLLIPLTEGNDTYNNSLTGATILALGGSDSITNSGASVTVDLGNNNNYFYNTGNRVSAVSGNGADTVFNDSDYSSINTGDGNDSIKLSRAHYSSIIGGNGADYISLDHSDYDSIFGGAGNDTVIGIMGLTYIDGGAGNDFVSIGGDTLGGNHTISGGAGNDTLYGNSHTLSQLFLYSSGDGNDLICNFDAYDTLKIGNGSTDTYSKATVGSNIHVSVGNGVITLKNAASLESVNISGREVAVSPNPSNPLLITLNDNANSYNNSLTGATILALGGNDSITNNAQSVSIDAGAGYDSIVNNSFYVTVSGQGGNDTILNNSLASYAHLSGGSDSDSIKNYALMTTIYGGDAADTITNIKGSSARIYGDGGNDFIENTTLSNQNDAKSAYIYGGTGNDTIKNSAMSAKLFGDADNDSIFNEGSTVTAYGGSGNDTIINFNKTKPLIYGDGGHDLISLTGSSASTVYGGSGNDTVYHGGSMSSVFGGADNDVISIIGGIYTAKVSVSGGTGNDTIYGNSFHHTMISGSGVDFFHYTSGDGFDVIHNFESVDTLKIGNGSTDTFSSLKSADNVIVTVGYGKVTLLGAASLDTLNILGTYVPSANPLLITLNDNANSYTNTLEGATILALGGNDTIKTSLAAFVSVDGGKGNDSLYAVGGAVTLNGGEGNDTVENLDNIVSKGSMLLGGNGTDLIKNFGNSSFVDGGADNDTIYSYGNKTSIQGAGGHDTIYNYGASISIDGGADNDYIYSNASNPTILGGTGNDTIDNRATIKSYLDGGEGADFIKSTTANSTIHGGKGNDTINNNKGGSNSSIDGGDNDDYIKDLSYNTNVTMFGGKGADTIISPGLKAKIIGGKDNDYISISGSNNEIKYSAGDGNDTLIGFNASSSLQIDGATYSKATVGTDIHVSVESAVIVLKGAASLGTVNILGEEIPTVAQPVLKIEDGAAIYGTEDETLLTIYGISTAARVSDFNISGKIVTISKNALGEEDVFLEGEGYTLKLASNVPTTATTVLGKWGTLQNNTATYTASASSAYYTLEDNVITYTANSGGETFTLNGIKSIAGSAVSIDEENKIVTLFKTALGTSTVTLDGDDFSLELDDGVNQSPGESEQKFTSYTLGTAVYKIFGAQAYYSLAGNEVTYTAATADKQYTISGLSNDLTLEEGDLEGVSADYDEETGMTFTLSEEALKNSDVTISGTNCRLALDEGVNQSAQNISGAWSDVTSGTASYSTNGKTKYYTLTDSKIVYHAATAGTLQIKLEGLSSNAQTEDGEIDGLDVDEKTLTVSGNAAGKNFTVKENKSNLEINLTDEVENISLTATSGTDKLNISGKNITVLGGEGNDSIKMTGSGVIAYASGEGNDTLNYSENYTLKITSGTIGRAILKEDDVILPVGNASITITDAKALPINLVLSNGASSILTVDNTVEPYLTYNANKTAVTVAADFTGTILSDDYDSAVKTITASAVTTPIEIYGNKNANYIIGNASKQNTLHGGAGNDTLKGGSILTGDAGSDVFVYSGGNVRITDYTANADKISVEGKTISDAALSGKDLVLTYGKNDTLTIANGKGKKITFMEGKTAKQYIFEDGKQFNAGKTEVTLLSSATQLNGNSYSALVTTDATKTSKAVSITGNAKDNKITAGAKGSTLNGGKGNDTLTGGAGIDVFVYDLNSGNEVIQNYTSGQDKISLSSGAKISSFTVSKAGDAVLKVDNNTVTLKKVGNENISANGKKITVVNTNGESTLTYYTDRIADDKGVTLNSTFKGKTFTAGNGIVTVDASQVTSAVKLNGNDKDNVLTGGAAADTVSGSTGNDKIAGNAGNDSLSGSDGNDTLSGGAGKDKLLGGSGNDSLNGGNDADTLSGEAGKDTLLGGKGNDYLTGGDEADSLDGGAGNDKLLGDAGNDILKGNTGNDKLLGGAGNDSLYGGAGNDTFSGGDGNDLFVYESGNDVITDYASGDKVSLGGAITKSAVKGSSVVLTINQNTLTLKNAKGKQLTLINTAGNESTSIIGGLKLTNSSKASATVPAYSEFADASSRTKAIQIVGSVLNNTILGGTGNDKINGGEGNDQLHGGAGNDSLWGGTGNDSLWGDAGADTFIYADGDGKDVIYCFEKDDLLQITGTFSGTYNKSKKEAYFKVGSTASAITLKEFTATTFNVNGSNYKISGSKLVKK